MEIEDYIEDLEILDKLGVGNGIRVIECATCYCDLIIDFMPEPVDVKQVVACNVNG